MPRLRPVATSPSFIITYATATASTLVATVSQPDGIIDDGQGNVHHRSSQTMPTVQTTSYPVVTVRTRIISLKTDAADTGATTIHTMDYTTAQYTGAASTLVVRIASTTPPAALKPTTTEDCTTTGPGASNTSKVAPLATTWYVTRRSTVDCHNPNNSDNWHCRDHDYDEDEGVKNYEHDYDYDHDYDHEDDYEDNGDDDDEEDHDDGHHWKKEEEGKQRQTQATRQRKVLKSLERQG